MRIIFGILIGLMLAGMVTAQQRHQPSHGDDQVFTADITADSFVTSGTAGVFDLAGGVDDDDCTGQQFMLWWDSTDSALEFCKNDTGAPSVVTTTP